MVTRVPCCLAMQRATARGTRDPLRRPPAPRRGERRTCQVAGCVVHNCHSSRRASRGRSRTVIVFSRCPRTERSPSVRRASTPRQRRVQTRTTRAPMQLLALQMVLPHAPVPVPFAFAVASRASSFASAPPPPPRHCLHCCTRRAHAIICRRPLARTAHTPRRPHDQKETTREEEPSRQRSRHEMAHHRDPGARDPGGECTVRVLCV